MARVSLTSKGISYEVPASTSILFILLSKLNEENSNLVFNKYISKFADKGFSF